MRERDGLGCHTTTSSELIELWPGTELVDTAGVREFGLGALTPLEVSAAMPDVAELARDCRFCDCSHVVEPDCAVRAAAGEGRIARQRFELYLRVATSQGPQGRPAGALDRPRWEFQSASGQAFSRNL